MADEKKKKLTVKEFRMWLEGVEEMQPEGWTPNETQWKRIREKIDQVQDTPPAVQEIPMTFTPAGAPMLPGTMVLPPSGNPLESMNIDPSRFPPPSPPPGAPFARADGAPTKTPSIDTSGGQGYKSSFA